MATPRMSNPLRRDDGDDFVLSLSRGRLISILTDTLADLDKLALTFDTPEVERARAMRLSLIGQIGDHVLPRLKDGDIPAIVVVGGSTGAGKSTLVNSVLEQEISEAGILRPTTRTPVLVVNPEDSQAAQSHPVAEVCRVVISPAVPAGLVLIDASDLDSVHDANRALASRLLEAADLWLFVTTAARYGDLTPWATLEEAARCGTAVAVVLNRAPAQVLPEVRRDLMGRLEDLGLSESPFFVIADAGPHEGLLASGQVRELRQWLELLAGRHRAAGLMRRADRSVWAGLVVNLKALAGELDEQDAAGHALHEATEALYREAAEKVRFAVGNGIAAEGATATRWVTAASSGAPLAPLVSGAPLRRGFMGRKIRARSAALSTLAGDVNGVIELTLAAQCEALADRVRREWLGVGAGEQAQLCLGETDSHVSEALMRWREGAVRAADAHSVPGLEPQAVADLLLCAAAGLDGAAKAAARCGLQEAVAACRDDLAGKMEEALRARVPHDAALRLIPDVELAASLRLRAGELSALVRTGGQ